MLAFASMLEEPAKRAGMKIPPDSDNFSREEYPHFAVFCVLQLGRRMQMGEQWENARIIADIPEEKLKTMTLEHFLKAGLHFSS